MESSSSTVRRFVDPDPATTARLTSCHHQSPAGPRHHKSSRQTSQSEQTAKHGLWYRYGYLCAGRPIEIIFTFLTLSICLFSLGPRKTASMSNAATRSEHDAETLSGHVVVNLIMQCIVVLYVYHQFRKLWEMGSKYLVGIAGLFTVFSTFIFSSGVINLLNGDLNELNDSLPLFILLTDLPKASLLARFALSSYTKEEVRKNIAKGISILAPSLTLDTMVETLAIGLGLLSGFKRIELLCYHVCLSVVVNYVIFMTFFPACLSLALDLSHHSREHQQAPVWQFSSLTKVLQLESEQAPNPVILRVKLIMSAGLTLVHTLSRWQLDASDSSSPEASNTSSHNSISSLFYQRDKDKANHFFEFYLSKYLSCGYEEMFMLGLVLVLTIRYIFFEENHVTPAAQQTLAVSPTRRLSNGSRNNRPIRDPVPEKSNSSTMTVTNADNPTILVSQDSDTESVIEGKLKEQKASNKRFFIGDDNSSDFSDVEMADKLVQTDESNIAEVLGPFKPSDREPRPLETLVQLLNLDNGPKELTDDEIIMLVNCKRLPAYRLESALADSTRGVHVRRLLLAQNDPLGKYVENLPYTGYEYGIVQGACCENVIGYMPVPVGIAGPLLIDDRKVHIPMATTEGCLVASTNRGCRAVTLGGGIRSSVYSDGMTRAPVVKFPTAQRASEVCLWLQKPENFAIIKEAFDSTSRFARLQEIHCRIAARNLHIRLVAHTGDAMGMNMLSKGSELAMSKLRTIFPEMQVVGLSGNVCTDKKPSAVNWIEGRGKSVVCECIVPAHVVKEVLKTTTNALVELNISKNLVGSALAGSIGGFNAHAANIVTAIYIATGQDPAQNVGSSNCITIMEPWGEKGEDLYMSCTMPSLEVGTVGGGTILPPQAACLEMLGVRGSCIEDPGRNARTLARIICGSVLAGELSVLSALAAGHLVRSHLTHNRSNVNIISPISTPSTPSSSGPSDSAQLFATSCKQL